LSRACAPSTVVRTFSGKSTAMNARIIYSSVAPTAG
jgi:hypothetical protein